MIPYILLFLFLAFLSLSDFIYTPPLYRKMILSFGGTFVFILFWALASLRWKTGTDWDSYYDAFTYFSGIYAVNFEPGYVLFVFFVRKYTENYTVFLAVSALLCISFKFFYFYKYHKEFFFTLIFLFYCYYFGDIFAVRQNLAISLTLFSTVFIINRKPILFVLFVSLATSLHYSSALYFFAYYIYWSTISDEKFYYLVVFSVAFGVFGVGWVVLDLFLKVLGLDGFIGTKINKYINEDKELLNTASNPLIMYLLGVLKRFLLIPLFVYVKKISKENFIPFQGYFNLYMVGNIIYFLFAKDLAVFARASVPFLIFEMFLIGYVLLYYKAYKNKIIFVFLIMVLFSFSRLNALINSYYDLYVPYYSIFNSKIDRIF